MTIFLPRLGRDPAAPFPPVTQALDDPNGLLAMGVLISMQEPTGPMVIDAAEAGFYESAWGKHPRLQILTIAELLAGTVTVRPRTSAP